MSELSTSWSNRVTESILKNGDAAAAVIRQFGHKPGGILPTEMLAFICVAAELGVRRVVESGRRNGYSTEVIAASNFDLVSIELNPVPDVDAYLQVAYVTARIIHGDGRCMIPIYIEGRAAVLLDGPKGPLAFQLADSFFGDVAFYAVHDCHERNQDGSDNPGRSCAIHRNAVLTEDVEALKTWHELDDIAWKGQYASRDEFVRYGSNLAIVAGGKVDL